VEGRRKAQQGLSHSIERQPQDHKTQRCVQEWCSEPRASESVASALSYEVPDTGSADDAVVMFGDALTTEGAVTFRTVGHGLSMRMKRAALLGDGRHSGGCSGGGADAAIRWRSSKRSPVAPITREAMMA